MNTAANLTHNTANTANTDNTPARSPALDLTLITCLFPMAAWAVAVSTAPCAWASMAAPSTGPATHRPLWSPRVPFRCVTDPHANTVTHADLTRNALLVTDILLRVLPTVTECDSCIRDITPAQTHARVVDGHRLGVCEYCAERIDVQEESDRENASIDRERYGVTHLSGLGEVLA